MRSYGWFAGLLVLLMGGSVMAGPPVRVVAAEGFRIELDLGSQVLGIEIPEDTEWAEVPGKVEMPLHASVAKLGGDLVSASILAQKAKAFDDGLYAAVELAAQEGAGKFGGKRKLLMFLAGILKDGAAGAPGDVILAATALGIGGHGMPEEVARRVRALTDEFLADDLRSKPLGFYTWSEALGEIFWQDRMLQTELEGADGIKKLVYALDRDSKMRGLYESWIELASRLTNPLAYDSLIPLLYQYEKGTFEPPEKGVRLLPPSRAHETEIVKKLFGARPIPDGFDLATEMVRQIKAGELDLTPRSGSGWYDYVTWSLEPLILPDAMPEAGRLHLGKRYRKELLELFKGILALTRETHVKQLEMPSVGAAVSPPSIDVRPELSAEPLPSHYFRRAEGYRFVRRVLEETFGSEALTEMHRLTPAGPVASNLAEELAAMTDLYHGACNVVSRQLGEEGAGTEEEALQAGAFATWSKTWRSDPDLARDVRMMVPVFYDIQRKKTKVWVFLGWTQKPVSIWFHKSPSYRVTDKDGADVPEAERPRVNFESGGGTLVYPVTAEVYVDELLDRDEFRKLCDRHRTKTKILDALK